MPNYVSKIKPDGMGGTEYNIKDAELREVVQTMQVEVAGTQTATGNPITLTDASETYAQGLSVEFAPKQDLHGQSAPYVGGAGKQKLPMTVDGIKAANTDGTWTGNAYALNGVTFTIQTDDGGNVIGIDLNDTSTGDVQFNLCNMSFSIGDYTLNDSATFNNTMFTFVQNKGGTNNDARSLDFTVTLAEQRNVGIYINGAGISFSHIKVYPMIRLSTETDPTFAPWENKCPISGYEGVEVDDVGFNQWDEEWESGGIDYNTGNTTQDADRIRSKNFISVLPNTEYFIKSGGHTTALRFYDANKNYISYGAAYNTDRAFTPPSNCKYLKFIILETTYNHDISINYPSTDHDYHPYQSRTASVTFGQTVMGGKVNVTDGGTDDELKKIDLGDLTWYYDSSLSRFYSTAISDKKAGQLSSDEIMCSCFKPDQSPISGSHIDGTIALWDRIYVNYFESTDATAFKTMVTGQELTYPLETTNTIATPKTDLKLLQDTNNITTNGTTITIDYIPNNSIGDAVKASEEYADRAVERVIPKAKLACFYEIFDESGTLYDANIPEDCNFFLVEYRIQNRIGSTLIKAKSIDFYIPVVVNVGGEQHWVEFLYNSIYHTIDYTSNVTTGFGVLSIYTI